MLRLSHLMWGMPLAFLLSKEIGVLSHTANKSRMTSPLFSQMLPEETGVLFRHENGAAGEKEMIETMGSGCALLDYDKDGRLDIYLVNGARLPSFSKQAPQYFNRLYRNEGNFRFSDVTSTAGVAGNGYGMGVTAADYDNDGFTDLYVTNFGSNQLLRNGGNATFVDVTAKAGVGAGGWSTSAAFFDYDRDGYLDLYVCRYLEYQLEKQRYCGQPELGWRSYCLPDLFPAASDRLFRNNGDGSFTDVSLEAGMARVKGKGLGVTVSDFDRDGWIDIFVANDRTRNFLFRNKGDRTFEEVGLQAGVALSTDGVARAGMGTDFGDFDQDGWPDVVVTNFETEGLALFRNQGSRFFRDESGERGLMEASFPYVGFGVRFMDYDNDGWLDLFVVNGHILDDIERYKPHMTYPQPKLLLRNDGQRFSPVRGASTSALAKLSVGRGAAFGDLDNDGAVDVVISNNNGSCELLRNEVGSPENSLLLKLVGTKSNRDGFGGRVELRFGKAVRVVEAKGAASYLSSNDPRLHVGLGAATRVDEVKVHWPSGKLQTLTALRAGFLYEISEDKGVVRSLKLAKRTGLILTGN